MADDDKKNEKTPAQLEREKIEVETVSAEDNGTVEAEASETEKEVGEKEEQAETEKEVEETEKEIEASENTEEALEAEKAAAKTQSEKDRIQRRIDREVSKRKKLEDENKELKAQLAAKEAEGDKFTKEDVQKEAKRLASETRAQEEFDAACDRLAAAGDKADKDFGKKIQAMSEDIGPIPSQMIGILDDLDNGGAVLAHLANNVDEAEELYKLSPARMALKLSKLSDKIAEETKPKPKPVSKVPAPNEPLKGGRVADSSQLYNPEAAKKMSDDEWIRKRNADVAQKRRDGRTTLY